ncbi:MAG: DNA-3-methyladenine glycosylase [Candidatus Kerfeldbacteria bacterium]
MRFPILGPAFFEQSALDIAPELIGKYLVRKDGVYDIEAMILDVEAYDGFDDKASHASRGKTDRNAPMFGPAGHWYIYLVYGMHWMLNIVTGKEGHPAAVLIRGCLAEDRTQVSGPARVTKLFGVDRSFDGSLAGKKTGLWFEDRGLKVPRSAIRQGPRIGVEYAGTWAKKPYRFYL